MSKLVKRLGDYGSGFYADAQNVFNNSELISSLSNINSFLKSITIGSLMKLLKKSPDEYRSFYLTLVKLVATAEELLKDPGLNPVVVQLLRQMIALAKIVIFMMEQIALEQLKEKPVYM